MVEELEKQMAYVIFFLFKCTGDLWGAGQRVMEHFARVIPSNSHSGPVRVGMTAQEALQVEGCRHGPKVTH